jgi:large subunit ribosomal protein L1
MAEKEIKKTDEMSDNQPELIEESIKSDTAKAGKRSVKAVKEAEEKQAKEIKKSDNDDVASKPKAKIIPTRSKLERRGKKYQNAAKDLTDNTPVTLDKAIEKVKKSATAKFDSTVEIHINLGVDPRHADQNIRETIVLPAGNGKKVTIAVFSDDAKNSGADIMGVEEITELLEKGNTNFDVLISSPDLMPKLGKYARVLGPRGLMPNPKSGTVTTDIKKAVTEAKAGKVEFRVDSAGIVHLGVGKVSFDSKDLQTNIDTVIKSIKSAKPSSVKSNYIKAIHLTSTMGPSVKIDVSSLN